MSQNRAMSHKDTTCTLFWINSFQMSFSFYWLFLLLKPFSRVIAYQHFHGEIENWFWLLNIKSINFTVKISDNHIKVCPLESIGFLQRVGCWFLSVFCLKIFYWINFLKKSNSQFDFIDFYRQTCPKIKMYWIVTIDTENEMTWDEFVNHLQRKMMYFSGTLTKEFHAKIVPTLVEVQPFCFPHCSIFFTWFSIIDIVFSYFKYRTDSISIMPKKVL